MRSVGMWAIGIATAMLLAACAIGGAVPVTPAPSTADTPAATSLELVVPGEPPERVTDVAGLAMTPEQLESVLRECERISGVPGLNEDCLNIDFNDGLLPCGPRSPVCIIWGSVTDSDVGAVQIRDDRGDASLCRAAARCEVVRVSSGIVGALREGSTTSSTTADATATSSADTTTTTDVDSTTISQTPPSSSPGS